MTKLYKYVSRILVLIMVFSVIPAVSYLEALALDSPFYAIMNDTKATLASDGTTQPKTGQMLVGVEYYIPVTIKGVEPLSVDGKVSGNGWMETEEDLNTFLTQIGKTNNNELTDVLHVAFQDQGQDNQELGATITKIEPVLLGRPGSSQYKCYSFRIYFTFNEASKGKITTIISFGEMSKGLTAVKKNDGTTAFTFQTANAAISSTWLYFDDFSKTAQLTYMEDGADVTETASWGSEDEAVATVEHGLVTPKGTGTTTITASKTEGKSSSCKVFCYEDGVYIDGKKLKEEEDWDVAAKEKGPETSLSIAQYGRLNDNNRSWCSTNTDVVSVSDYGVTKFKKNGTATIYAINSGTKVPNCVVTFHVTGCDASSDVDSGWKALTDFQNGFSSGGVGIKLGNHDVMTQSYNQARYENRLTSPVKADSARFTLQLSSDAKNPQGSEDGPLLDEMTAKKPQLVASAEEALALYKVNDQGERTKVASCGDGMAIKSTEFELTPTVQVTYQLEVDKGRLKKGASYVLTVGPGIESYGPLKADVEYQFETMSPAKSVTLDKNQLNLKSGDSAMLTAEMNKGEEVEADDTIIWTSADDTIADVDNNGKVTAKKAGATTIAATAMDGKVKAECKVTVSETAAPPTADSSISVTGIKLNVSKATLNVGKTKQLTATIAPENATNKNVAWTSSNPKIARVDAKGKVTAIAAGKATIAATTADGAFTAKAVITVKTVKVTGVKVNVSKASLAVGKTKTLKATVAPVNATNKNVTWTSSNRKIAKVSAKGKVTAVAPGQATITVTTKDGKFKKKIIVTVKPKAPAFNLSSTKRTATIKYKKVSGAAGYEIYRADSKNGKYYKITTRTQGQKGICASYNLKAKHTYYYKIRTYQTVNGKKLYSGYSAVKKVKTK